MSEHVTVEAVKDARDWNSDDGKIKLTFYTLDVKRENGLTTEVDHSRKQGGAEPQPGEELDVIFEEGKYRPKMKKAPQGSFAGRSTERSTGTKGKGNWQPESARDPERAARILRQHSQDMALRWAGLLAKLQPAPELTLPKIFKIADAFDQDVIQAGQAANQGAGAPGSSPTSSPQGESPSTSPAPGSLPVETDDAHQWFSKLLEDAHVDATAAHELGRFIAEKFSDEQKKKAQRELQELGVQGDCVRRLTTAYEQSTGKLLPLSSEDEAIPF